MKVVWAIDASESDEFLRNARTFVNTLRSDSSTEIFAIHILKFPYAHSAESTLLEESYLKKAEERMKEFPNAKILIDRKGTYRSSIDLVNQFARGLGAEAILVSTHSRGALSRFFLGSFAESLLLQSDIPIITVNPGTKVRESLKRVLFPTTFEKTFFAAFQNAVRVCSAFKADLTVFYKEPFVPMMEDSTEVKTVLESESARRKSEARRWQEYAQRYQVPLTVHMDTIPGEVADEIESFSRENDFDLIMMVSEALAPNGPQVGSLSRKIVRAAPCPVWTMKADRFIESQ